MEIFPCKRGFYKYSFEKVCQEDEKLKLHDGTTTIFMNTEGYLGDILDKSDIKYSLLPSFMVKIYFDILVIV